MYEAFYGLSCKPFQLNPDPAFYFASKQHRRAKAYLDYGVLRNEGFIVITGEIGAGKTTVLRGLLEGLNQSNVVVGQLVTTQLDAEDTLRMVGAAFGLRVKDVPKSELLIALEAFLLSMAQEGKRCLLIVDEAQNLSLRAVEELRMLSNYQLGNQSLLQSFLLGQPEFRQILQRPEMEQFRQRVAATCHIGPLDLEDTQHYIEHRLRCAGGMPGKPEFESGVIERVHQASAGIPRRINALCDRLLLLGYLANSTRLTISDVEQVIGEFASEAALPGGAPVAFTSELQFSGAEPISQEASRLIALQHGDRLQRLEHSLLRLEHINLQTLSLLERLLAKVGPANTERGSADKPEENEA
jgi:putative secretion ATPase (PEP-CTERM system associated)